jgi:hypothetical protein
MIARNKRAVHAGSAPKSPEMKDWSPKLGARRLPYRTFSRRRAFQPIIVDLDLASLADIDLPRGYGRD